MSVRRPMALCASTLSSAVLLTFVSLATGCGDGSQPSQTLYRECGPQGTTCPDDEPKPEDQDDTYPCGPQGATCPKLPR